MLTPDRFSNTLISIPTSTIEVVLSSHCFDVSTTIKIVDLNANELNTG